MEMFSKDEFFEQPPSPTRSSSHLPTIPEAVTELDSEGLDASHAEEEMWATDDEGSNDNEKSISVAQDGRMKTDGDSSDENEDAADVDIRDWEPPNWKFNLYAIGNRSSQWVMDSQAQRWLATRMYHFDNIRGPDGVSMRVYRTRMKRKIKDKKAELIEELYQHWKTPHTFDYLLGENPSKLELKQAYRRVSTKLNALIGNRGQISKRGPDIFKILFEQVRRPSAKDIWAHEQEAIVGPMVIEEMVKNKWKPSMLRQKTLPIQMKARKKVFNRLPEAEKQIWRAKAATWEPKPLTQKELFAALPKLLFTFGDAVRKYLKWTIFIWAGGLTDTGKPASIREEWYDEDDADTQALLDSKEYQAVNTVFNGVLARKHKLPIEEVQTMLPYRPRIPNSIIPQGVPLLKDMIEYDPATNNVLTDSDTLIKALTLYLQDTYALVPTVDGKKRKGKQLIPP
ncbi:hypothetical protein M422DRAFT_267710 [Sphaerobolus stellatus SS14]|uniref:Uncharacterized protein n=1 Tax=Sphaerobolus stellatus (strain SS14) TaxID=990650 RepID=A0A0C9U8A7_SPHS4|nr:hypothetical protein M422DRAFT_267710 [Sphaerobolus stellatus SS14]